MALFYLLVFPGVLFLALYSLLLEFFDRKVYAYMQNRQGPPWYQPFADITKLVGKETIIPEHANPTLFKVLPTVALASVLTAMFCIPIWGKNAVFSFNGDLILVLYLLTIPTMVFFLAGWTSRSVFASIGSVRVLTQMFSYEVPLFMALLSPAFLANTWSISGMAEFYSANPLYILFNIPAFFVALIAVQGKLERTPFDAPEAETEIVAGSFTEYGGRLLAIFRMVIDTEMVVAASLISAIFIPIYFQNVWLGILIYIVKTVFIVFLLSIIRAIAARLRMEQMVKFCWKVLVPIALAQMVLNIILKGVFLV